MKKQEVSIVYTKTVDARQCDHEPCSCWTVDDRIDHSEARPRESDLQIEVGRYYRPRWSMWDCAGRKWGCCCCYGWRVGADERNGGWNSSFRLIVVVGFSVSSCDWIASCCQSAVQLTRPIRWRLRPRPLPVPCAVNVVYTISSIVASADQLLEIWSIQPRLPGWISDWIWAPPPDQPLISSCPWNKSFTATNPTNYRLRSWWWVPLMIYRSRL